MSARDLQDLLPVTALVACRNEEKNLGFCLEALRPVGNVIVLDSRSTDGTAAVAEARGARVVQFEYAGGYPKKRQWALDTLRIDTPWVLLVDADEIVPDSLWEEMRRTAFGPDSPDAFLISKEFHFLGRRMRFGGFSHSAVLLFRRGMARFERLVADDVSGLDMEVHERLLVRGRVGRLSTPLIHRNLESLHRYIEKHNEYSTWEAQLRYHCLVTGRYGEETISARPFGNSQERRRLLKRCVMRLPCEHWLWFLYHYVLCLGFLEGRRGLIAAQLRSGYVQQVKAKIHELRVGARHDRQYGVRNSKDAS